MVNYEPNIPEVHIILEGHQHRLVYVYLVIFIFFYMVFCIQIRLCILWKKQEQAIIIFKDIVIFGASSFIYCPPVDLCLAGSCGYEWQWGALSQNQLIVKIENVQKNKHLQYIIIIFIITNIYLKKHLFKISAFWSFKCFPILENGVIV